jgi:hypothetical protein
LEAPKAEAPATMLNAVAAATAAPAAPAAMAAMAAEIIEMPKPTEAPAAAQASVSPQQSALSSAPLRPMVIRNADLVLIVDDPLGKMNRIGQIAEQSGGYVVTSQSSSAAVDVQVQMTVRVDSTQFQSALDQIRKLAVKIQGETTRGDDVTAEFVDLTARVRNLEVMEAQLQEFYKRATTTPDLLSTYNQAMEVRGQIEQAKGRMQFLSALAAQSTINISLLPNVVVLTPTPTPTPTPIAWQPGKTFDAANKELTRQSQRTADGLIWFGVVTLPGLLAVLLPLIALILLARAALRRLHWSRPALTSVGGRGMGPKSNEPPATP